MVTAGLKLVGEKDDFSVYFDSNTQNYTVYKGDKILISNKYKFSEIKSYLD